MEKLLQTSNSQTGESYHETTRLPAPPLDTHLTLTRTPPQLLALIDFKLIRDASDTLYPLRHPTSTYQHFLFELHGYAHGKRLLRDPLIFTFTPTDLHAALTARLKALSHDPKAHHGKLLVTVPLPGHPRVALEVECPPGRGKLTGKVLLVRRIRVQVGYKSATTTHIGCPQVVSLREVKEGLARQAREEAEGRERKRKWIMTGGS